MNTGHRFFLPLERKEEKYCVSDDVDITYWRSAPVDDTFKYVERHHTIQRKEVEIFGKRYSIDIYESSSDDDYSFVEVDENLFPIDVEMPNEYEADLIADYLDSLLEQISYSEGMLPDQRIYLKSQYLPPYFIRPDQPSKEKALLDWRDILAFQKVVIVGEPGIGKTSFLRKMVIDLADKCVDDGRITGVIPVYLQLRNWDEGSSLTAQIKNALTSFGDGSINRIVDTLIEEGTFALILDGYDEVSDSLRPVFVSDLHEFSSAHPKCNIVISTRPSYYNNELQGHKKILLCDFNNAQIKEFSYRKLFKKKSWKKFASYIEEAKDLGKIIGNPLLLSIAIILYLREQIVPQNRAQLIRAFVDALTEEWDAARGINRLENSLLNPIRTRNYLGRISYYCHLHDKVSFTSEEVRTCFSAKTDLLVSDSNLIKIFQLTGLISKSANNQWQFSHTVIKDYFTASYLVDRNEGAERIFSEKYKNPNWMEVWYNMKGLSSDPEYFYNLFKAYDPNRNLAQAKYAAHLLLQSPLLEREQIEELCEILKLQLEKHFRNYEQSDILSKQESNADIVASLCIRRIRDVRNLKDEGELIELISLIFKARATIYRHWIEDALIGSDQRNVRTVGGFLDKVGHLSTAKDKDVLEIFIAQESPNIKYE